MKIRRILALLLALGLLLALAACGGKQQEGEPGGSSAAEPEPDPNWPVQLQDGQLDRRPERIVSLSPALTEILCELGGGDRLVGVSDYCDYPERVVEALPRCGSAQVPDREALEALEPQVVFASAPLSEGDEAFLRELGAQVVVLRRAGSVDLLLENYVSAATVLDGMVDGTENGERAAAELRDRWRALNAAADAVERRWHGVYLREVPLMTATGDTFESELLAGIGVDNDAAAYTGWQYPPEQAVNLYPDVLFYDASIDPEYFKSTQVYSTTDAYKQGRMYPVEGIALERQSGRMFDELEKMFRAAYPDVEIPEISSGGGSGESEDGGSGGDDGDDGMLDINDATKINE